MAANRPPRLSRLGVPGLGADRPVGRRDVLRAGGLAVSLGAIVAACGDDRTGLEDPGRVGNAPVATDLPSYEVDQAVLLRTASSLEYTALEVYATAGDLGVVPEAIAPFVDPIIDDHQQIADRMVELTSSVGGTPYECTNDWIMDRLVGPVLVAIQSGDRQAEEMAADVAEFATALENIATAAHQQLASAAESADIRLAHIEAATIEARHAALLAIAVGGGSSYISPAILGEEVTPNERGGIRQFALPARFNQVAQVEIKAGPADENNVRESFLIATPAENSLVYNELEGCDA